MGRKSSQDSSTGNKSPRQPLTMVSYAELMMKFRITQITSESVIQKPNFFRILLFFQVHRSFRFLPLVRIRVAGAEIQVHLTGIIHVIMHLSRLRAASKEINSLALVIPEALYREAYMMCVEPSAEWIKDELDKCQLDINGSEPERSAWLVRASRVSNTNDRIQKMDLNCGRERGRNRRQRSSRQLIKSLRRVAETNSVRSHN